MRASLTVAAALDEGTTYLQQHRPRTPRLDAEMLLAHALGRTRSRLYAASYELLAEATLGEYRRLLELRRQGVPVAYIVGWKEFYSRRFAVSPQVLIPRPETELLVDMAVQLLRRQGLVRPRVLDIGTGSGAIAVTLAMEFPTAQVVATDIEPGALEVAGENIRSFDLESRVQLLMSDVFEALSESGPFDLIVSNPPYVGTDYGPRPEENVVRNEPGRALFAGPDGLDVVRRLIAQSPAFLAQGAHLLMEMAPFQVEGVEAMMVEQGFQDTRILPDLSGLPRALIGRWEQ